MNRLLLSAILCTAVIASPVPAAPPEGRWMDVEGVSVPEPPAEHPRLFLRGRDLKDLQRRTEHPATRPAWQKLETAAQGNPLVAVEIEAVRYLLTRDSAQGRRTAAAGLKLLQEEKINRKGQDATRPIGRLMVAGAIAYDWCYPVLTPDQKQAYIKELLRLAKDLESGYPPPKRDAVTGHYSEWMVMRDLLAAGVAVYDEFPEMYRIAAHRFFAHFMPVRNWWYPGHAFHQGTSYFETRFSSDLYPLFIFDRLGAGNVYHPAQQFVPYQSIYLRRPDGQMVRAGDGQGKPPKLRSLLVAAYYKDPYILADYLIEPGVDAGSAIFEFLWSDLDLKPRPLSELPLSRFMGHPYGWMVARSGWDAHSVIAEMKVNIYNFGNHQHLDAGAFQIYYKGPLAIDSGIYEGTVGGYGNPHDVNYHKRTIAHNSLLIHDPAEVFRWRSTDRVYSNDGGQKFPNTWREPRSVAEMLANYKTGDVLGHGFGPDPVKPAYTYLKGDLTHAYSSKVREVKRAFVYLNLGGKVPAALVVFDKVVSANPEFKKYWLLHTMEEPKVEGDSFTVTLSQRGWTGKLVNKVVLPRASEIATVGGPGKEFWVFGENFPNQPRGAHIATAEPGEWRVEVSPRQPAETDYFLNVLQPMEGSSDRLPVDSIQSGEVVGIQVANRVVLFNRESAAMDRPVSFPVRGQGTFGILVTDLGEGTWQVWRDGAIVNPALSVSASEGTLWLQGPAGNYSLRR